MKLVEPPIQSQVTANILILDDDRIILDSLGEFLLMDGYGAFTANDFQEAKKILSRQSIQIVITDLNMPSINGLEFLKYVRENYPQIVVMVITGFGSIESAVDAIKLGAYDYLTKPIIDDELRMSIQRALKQQALQAENAALKKQLRQQNRFCEIIGRDRQMQKVFDLIEAVASTSTTVLVTGESGTGKTLVAHAIHRRSPRRDGPFIEVSCGALPENLLESELFGHVRGSFTGAVGDKHGRFMAAEGGTIFLDEIDSASPALQVKLLRVLQERQFEPVGSNKTINVNVRVIVATNKNLKKLVEEEKFRQDLYYRINVIDIRLSPLCDRVSDIPILTNHFLEKFSQMHQKPIQSISPEAMNLLARYRWPGNVRELENAIERAVVLTRSEIIFPDDLPAEMIEPPANDDGQNFTDQTGTLEELILKTEKQIIRKALGRFEGNRQLTAKALGISRTSLFRKMRDLELMEMN
ncbi:MAG: sigma-54 dependent transcriptional regulator [Phycisphaerae bacterium]